MKKLLIMIGIGLPFAIVASFLPDTPFNFDWILGWAGAVCAINLK